MSLNDRRDVVIFGGGCAGLWLAHHLGERGISCVVLDQQRFAQYASTRNQGWLQSGAYYASLKDQSVAEACRQGYRFIEDFARDHNVTDVLHKDISCYFLYDDDAHLRDTLTLCSRLSISIQPIALAQVEAAEPILRGSPYTSAAIVDDCPIDTQRLLQVVADQAAVNGAAFRTVSSLDAITPVWMGNKWLVRLEDGSAIECAAIVAACGVYIPTLLNRLIPGQVPGFKCTKIPVLVIHGHIANSMLITPRITQGPNLVPFRSAKGTGATICLARNDTEIIDPNDEQLPEPCLEEHAASVGYWFTGIETMIRQGSTATAHFYVCQKISLRDESSRTHVLLAHAPQSGTPMNVVTFYPGKFSAAPIAAQECADALMRLLGGSNTGLVPQKMPMIAEQQYYNPPTYKLVLQGGRLSFQQLP